MEALAAGFALGPQLHAIWTWRGVWRWLAAAPILIMAAFVVALPILVSYDPAFHAAWLAILRVLNFAGAMFVGLLWLARMLIRLATEF